jgi:glutathione S-transferase
LKIECEEADISKHLTASGADYYKINPKGNVPCLILDDGTLLNEGAATLQAIADLAPGKVAPANGSSAR